MGAELNLQRENDDLKAALAAIQAQREDMLAELNSREETIKHLEDQQIQLRDRIDEYERILAEENNRIQEITAQSEQDRMRANQQLQSTQRMSDSLLKVLLRVGATLEGI